MKLFETVSLYSFANTMIDGTTYHWKSLVLLVRLFKKKETGFCRLFPYFVEDDWFFIWYYTFY